MHTKIPALIFGVTLVSTIVLVLVMTLVFEKTKDTHGVRAMPPFPNIAPLVAAPPAAKSVCVNLIGDASGRFTPSPKAKLQPCISNDECLACTTSPVDVPVHCDIPSREIANQQADLDNPSARYCIPKTKLCLPELQSCSHDADCAVCDDEVGDGQAMQCEMVSKPKNIQVGDETVEVPSGRWCLPRTGTCDSANASLQWTLDGWKCECKYPSIFGGEACDIFLACNNPLTTDWSAGNQQLLVNENTDSPRVWAVDTDINPMLCHVEGAPESEWDKPCGKDTIPNVVCQCDGLMKESLMGFRNDTHDPLTCVPDSCSMNANGGRANEPFELKEWAKGVPPNHCVCSGRDSRIWRPGRETDDPDVVHAQDGYAYTGRCTDTQIATNGAVVTLRADPGHAGSEECGRESNMHAEITSLVPGFAENSTRNALVSVCSDDPCRGRYSDPNFRPPEDLQSLGHYNAAAGSCECKEARAVKVDTDIVVNPVGSTCADACAGMASEDPADWPCKNATDRPCPGGKPRCITGSRGEAVCLCPEGCGNIDGGTCAEQYIFGEQCTGDVDTPNICKPYNGVPTRCACHQGRARDSQTSSCHGTPHFFAVCTTDTGIASTCHYGEDRNAAKCGGGVNFRCGSAEPNGCARRK